jgi:hypothetical protein
MMDTSRHATPPLRDALVAQMGLVGFALRTPAFVAALLVAVATGVILFDAEALAFRPEHYVMPGLLGILLPISVWRGETRFGGGFLWTLPVDRRHHALARVFAGWLWLMGAVVLFVLWLLTLAILTGGSVLAPEVRAVLPTYQALVTFDPGALQHVRWTPDPRLWLVPFAAATCAYVFASALTLGTRQPLRWIVGGLLGGLLLVAAGDVSSSDRLLGLSDRIYVALLHGPYGIDALLTARTETLQVAATFTTGETRIVWRGLPNPGEWALATLGWTTAGLGLLWLAASRHAEQRRS